MLAICSFVQSICHLVHVLASRTVRVTKRMHRTAAVLMTGTAVVAVLAFSCGEFSGGGRNALTVFAGSVSQVGEDGQEAEEEEEEGIILFAETAGQSQQIDAEFRARGRRMVGDTLAESVAREQEIRQARRAVIQKNQEENQRIALERAEEEARRAAAVVAYSDQDYEVLTKIVQAEAGVCDMKGKILVANVVINRVKDEEFPDDITDVVYQRNQFSPVLDGTINQCHVSEETVEAVDRALSGEDYSDGALYFMNRGISQAGNVRWFDGRLTYLFRHESHEFFK